MAWMSMTALCALLVLASAAVSSVAAQSHAPTNLVSTGAVAAVTNRVSAIPEAESRADLHVALSGTPEQRALLLGKLKQRDDPRLSAWLVDVLNDPDLSFTSEAARMLVDMHYSGTNALAGFVRLLKPENGPVLGSLGARGLGNLRDPRAVPHLAKALAEDGWMQVRADAATALGRIGTPEALEALRSARRQSLSFEFRMLVDVVLGRSSRDAGTISNLVAVLLAPDTKRLMMETGIEDKMMPKEFSAAVDGILGTRVENKLAAAMVLGELGGEPAVRGLLASSRAGDARLRAASAEALGEGLGPSRPALSPETVRQALERLRQLAEHDKDTRVREAAKTSLRRRGDVSASGSDHGK